MKILTTFSELRQFRQQCHGTVGFVPTMGALHEGHASLLRMARKKCDQVILSIFVNPTQFNDPKDLEKYPRTLESDKALADREGIDAIYFPNIGDLYSDDYLYEVREKKWSRSFCGAHRPGHFEGVLTIVMKLLNQVRADYAFFGEKDYQQLRLIQGMVEAFFLPVQIIPVPTLRESDGLAMSSRNIRLTSAERKKAPLFYQHLKEAKTSKLAVAALEADGFKIDYVEDWEGRRLGAIVLGEVRLIDNIELETQG